MLPSTAAKWYKGKGGEYENSQFDDVSKNNEKILQKELVST